MLVPCRGCRQRPADLARVPILQNAETSGMSASNEPSIRTFLDRDMTEAVSVSVAGGVVVVFSGRSPLAEGPNQDAAAVIGLAPGAGVLVACDGLGGMSAGDVAANLTVDAISSAVERADTTDLHAAILTGVEVANRQILELGNAGTTLVVAEIRQSKLRAYHVGDSTLLLADADGHVRYLTVAHSPVGYAVEAGLLDEKEAMFHAERHLISNMVGSPTMHVEIGPELDLEPGDTVLLGTDGVFDNLHVEEIVAALGKASLAEVAGELTAGCRQRMELADGGTPSKPDDHTFLVWRPSPPP